MNPGREESRDTNMNGVVLAFMPLVLSVAKRYQGEGVEFNDLVQEGMLLLCLLYQKCRNLELFAAYVNQRLPRYLKWYANASRWDFKTVGIDGLEEVFPDLDSERQTEEAELFAALKAKLTAEEMRLCMLFYHGYSQAEAALILEISQAKVSRLLRELRWKLWPLLIKTSEPVFAEDLAA